MCVCVCVWWGCVRVCACVRVIVCVHLLHSYAWTLVDVYIICYIFVKLLITFSILMYIICYIMLVQRSEPPVRRFTNPLLLLCFCLLYTPPPPPPRNCQFPFFAQLPLPFAIKVYRSEESQVAEGFQTWHPSARVSYQIRF